MRFVILSLSLLFALLTACMGPTFIVQQYGGPARPRESIAILRVNGGDSVRLLFLDEEDVTAPLVSDGRLHIELLPGRHTLTARNGDDRTAPQGSLAFAAEPNKVYRVVFSGETAHVYEVDRESDKPGKDVTSAPPEPPPVKLPPVAPAPSAEPPASSSPAPAPSATPTD